MLELFMVVLILGVLAWLVTTLPIPSPFKQVLWAILIIVLIVVLFRFLTGLNLGRPIS